MGIDARQNPRVTVVIPAYNRAATLPRAVKSVLGQTFQDFEIIIVDDASTENIKSVIDTFKDPRLVYLRHEMNQGGGAARNTGIKNAKAEWIAFLDSDDEWLPEKLQEQIKKIESRGADYVLIYTGVNIIVGGGRILRTIIEDVDGEVKDLILVKNFITTTSSVMIRKDALLKVDGFDPKMKSCQDWDLFIRLAQIGKVTSVAKPLVNHYWDDAGNRISKNRKAVMAGHQAIQVKYQGSLEKLPSSLRAKHLEEISFIYYNQQELELGKQMLIEAFRASRNPLFLLKAFVRTRRYAKQTS